jgi:hypothetical protein
MFLPFYFFGISKPVLVMGKSAQPDIMQKTEAEVMFCVFLVLIFCTSKPVPGKVAIALPNTMQKIETIVQNPTIGSRWMTCSIFSSITINTNCHCYHYIHPHDS